MMVGSAGKVLNFEKHANNKKKLCINTESCKSTPIYILHKLIAYEFHAVIPNIDVIWCCFCLFCVFVCVVCHGSNAVNKDMFCC
jgi:hypothetical protein